MSEFLEITGKVFGVIGAAASAALGIVKLYRAVKEPPDKDRDSDDEVDRREQPRSGGTPWFIWRIVAALAVLLLGLAMLVVGSRLGKTGPREIVDKPDARKVQQARERLQFRDGIPIPARDLHTGMWDLMYSGIIQKEYGGKVILVTGPVKFVSNDSVTLEAGPFPATVTCSFGIRHRDRIKTLSEGLMVTIRAEIQTYRNGNDGEVLKLVECELVSAEGGEKADPKRGPRFEGLPTPTVEVRFADTRVTVPAGGTTKLRIKVGDDWKPHDTDMVLRFEIPPGLTLPAEVKVPKGQLEVEVPLTAGNEPGKYIVKVVPVGVRNTATFGDSVAVTVSEKPKPVVPPDDPPVVVTPPKKEFPKKEPPRKELEDRLTTEYLPHKVGTVWTYDTTATAGPDAGTVMRTKITHKEGGVLETTLLRTGKAGAGGMINWGKDQNKKGDLLRFRVRKEFLDLGPDAAGATDPSWEPVLKVGAKPGDTWEWRPPDGGLKTYKLAKLEVIDGRLSAVVETFLEKGKYNIAATSVYVRGVGEVERIAKLTQGGIEAATRMRMVEEP